MFLFLSKLLPIFIYPLGLACLLMLLALLMYWRRSRLVPLPLFLALVILVFSSNSWVSNTLVRSLEWRYLPQGELPNAEAIVILGGSTSPAWSPRPTVEINGQGDRVFYGAKLYQDGKAPFIIAAGGRITWRDGGPSEASDMAQLLEMMGVPPAAIIQEPDSLNTYENAVNVKQILVDRGIEKILLVTSAMHMPRSLLLFRQQGVDTIPAPTDFLVTQVPRQELPLTTQELILKSLPDTENFFYTTKAIKEYVGLLVYRLRGWL